ncbi:hypothetical protein MTR67_001529 [Solanum verrucosum]|uniref:CCHC-type domain-containing protein n=1 Tax=Solanum verrucosum TaxID=315347 RepID=A0AAF0PNE1_SOLVR|nr:hypothetical protein MTR67_001529 [Solanum verrucosum]
MEEEARGKDALFQTEVSNITTKVHLITSNNATPETHKNTSLKPKKKKFRKNNGRPQKKNNGENNQAQNQQVQDKGPCFVCGKSGHIARFCRFWKCGPNPQAKVSEEPFLALIIDITLLRVLVDGGLNLVQTVMSLMTKIGLKNILILSSPNPSCLVILTQLKCLEQEMSKCVLLLEGY